MVAAYGSTFALRHELLDVWGEVEKDFAASARHLSLRVKWARSSTVPMETFGVVASWDPWRDVLDVYASVQRRCVIT
jgi:CO/xanthine dehydrogenase Mo-binding subunit